MKVQLYTKGKKEKKGGERREEKKKKKEVPGGRCSAAYRMYDRPQATTG